MPDANEVIKIAGRYDSSTFITILLIVIGATAFAAWFKYGFLPSEKSRRESNALMATSISLMGQSLSAVSGLLSQTHEKVSESHVRIESVEYQMSRMMSAKILEAEMIDALSKKSGLDLSGPLGKMQGILHEFHRRREDR